MKTFKYSLIPKFVYRYANIPATIIIVLYLIISSIGIVNDWMFIFPLAINLILIYVLNRFYFKMYKNFPFKVEIDNEKMFCSDFLLNNRTVKINLLDIEEIKGGIFSGRAYMPLYIKWEGNQIGISPHMKNYNKFLTIILTNIKKELYDKLLDEVKTLAGPLKKDKKKK
ncbi:MAG: hypothetical protein GY936_15600 [Ignavibacteriae bacterium]|nr:hypothetical protein [Ignavibacteriota bacterium]